MYINSVWWNSINSFILETSWVSQCWCFKWNIKKSIGIYSWDWKVNLDLTNGRWQNNLIPRSIKLMFLSFKIYPVGRKKSFALSLSFSTTKCVWPFPLKKKKKKKQSLLEKLKITCEIKTISDLTLVLLSFVQVWVHNWLRLELGKCCYG